MIGVSQLSRIAGGLLGIAFWISVGVVGSIAYDQGGGIGLPGFKFPRELFYAVCALFVVVSVFTTYAAYARKKQFPHDRRPPARDEDQS